MIVKKELIELAAAVAVTLLLLKLGIVCLVVMERVIPVGNPDNVLRDVRALSVLGGRKDDPVTGTVSGGDRVRLGVISTECDSNRLSAIVMTELKTSDGTVYKGGVLVSMVTNTGLEAYSP